VIIAPTDRVVDVVLAAFRHSPFEQPKLFRQRRIVGNRNLSAREQRHHFEVQLRLVPVGPAVADAALLKSLRGIIIARDVLAAVALRKFGEFRRDGRRIKWRAAATNDVGDNALAIEVSDAYAERIMPAGARIGERDIVDSWPRGQFERATVFSGGLD
jgi:hypothetical protein